MERAKGTATEEDEEEERKRIFHFIDSFRYTGVTRRGANGKTLGICKRVTDTDTDTDTATRNDPEPEPETKPTPPPVTPPAPVPVKKRTPSVRAVASAPGPVGATSNAKKQRRLPKAAASGLEPEVPEPVPVPVPVPVRAPRRKPRALASELEAAGPGTPIVAVDGEKRKIKCRSTLTTTEKVMEAYRRVPPDFKFRPPRSCHNLIQEDHAFDPWRVLVICMLLNNTTGAQVKKVVEDLFALCPDAETTLQVDVERIEEVIRSLGLQNKRARLIKCFSEEYLYSDWSHVTFLPGIGKYAADAYAIFCTGRGADVRPDDHKLVDYWNCFYDKTSDIMPQSIAIDFWSDDD